LPPEAAFNDRKVLLAEVDAYWSRAPGQRIKGQQFQRGFGAYTLCESCNSLTGAWYGPQFVEWCRQGMEFLDRTGGMPSLIYMHLIYPLRVIKQIATMFVSLGMAAPEFVRFARNREAPYLDPGYRFWIYYLAPGCLRVTTPCALVNLHTGAMTTGLEFSFPPFGYMLTIDSRPTDRRPVEITHFTRFGYNEMHRAFLELPVLPTHTPVLSDYRAFAEKQPADDEPKFCPNARRSESEALELDPEDSGESILATVCSGGTFHESEP
jgi:hypothetical protein